MFPIQLNRKKNRLWFRDRWRRCPKGHRMHFEMPSQIKKQIFKCQSNRKWFFVHTRLCCNRMFDHIDFKPPIDGDSMQNWQFNSWNERLWFKLRNKAANIKHFHLPNLIIKYAGANESEKMVHIGIYVLKVKFLCENASLSFDSISSHDY